MAKESKTIHNKRISHIDIEDARTAFGSIANDGVDNIAKVNTMRAENGDRPYIKQLQKIKILSAQ